MFIVYFMIMLFKTKLTCSLRRCISNAVFWFSSIPSTSFRIGIATNRAIFKEIMLINKSKIEISLIFPFFISFCNSVLNTSKNLSGIFLICFSVFQYFRFYAVILKKSAWAIADFRAGDQNASRLLV